MKRAVLAGMCGMVFLLSSCGGNADKTSADEDPKALEVKLTGPVTAEPHEKAEYKAEVFYGGKRVTDADEVMFEVWKEGKKGSGKTSKAKEEKGAYYLRTEFDKEGVYTVQSHVTAKQQHNMPTVKVRVGDAEAADDSSGREEKAQHH
ncbi:FixH family protein [Bacillus siamensis]|uniref:FixH family protein n=1 Tax=Bacillus siamensis TaxID=659243 RepID=UPI0005F94A09|nr:FixH family protein [Bacillus siamensis]